MSKVAIAIVVLMSFVYLGTSFAERGEVINDVCPVMGSKVDKDTPFTVEYKGQTIGFCCAGCPGMFQADPEKYMQKLQKKRTIECPKCGAEIEVPAE